MKKTIITLTSIAALAGVSSAQTITNSSLTGTATNTYNQSVPTGWSQFNGGSSDTWNSSVSVDGMSFSASSDGGSFVRSNGIAPEGLQQTVTGLTIGGIYAINFEQSLSSDSASTFNAGNTNWRVTFGGQTIDSTLMLTPNPGQNFGWQNQSLTFTATAATQNLQFVALNPQGSHTSTAIDGISLTSVPEPSSTVLLGLGALGLIARRKK